MNPSATVDHCSGEETYGARTTESVGEVRPIRRQSVLGQSG